MTYANSLDKAQCRLCRASRFYNVGAVLVSVVLASVILMRVVMVNVIFLSVILLNVVMLSVLAPKRHHSSTI